jgi:hypothetical protein
MPELQTTWKDPAFPVEKNRAIIIWKKKPEAIQDLFKGLTDE